jgi:TolB-like protein/Flp pilus assembly protein TadD
LVALERAGTIGDGDPSSLLHKVSALDWLGRYDEAERTVQRAQTIRATGRGLVWEAFFKLNWHGDLDGAALVVERWPAWLLLEQRGAFMASQVWFWRREPDKAIAVLAPIARDHFTDTFFTGPKSGLLALAHEMAGNKDAAAREWENARRVAERVTAEDPTARRTLAWRGTALARAGNLAEAEGILRDLEQTKDLFSEFWSCAAPSALLRIAAGHGDEVMKNFDSERRSGWVSRGTPVPQAALKLNPVFDPIRATPEFQQWMAAAPAPEEKKGNKTAAAPVLVVNEKSLVVLPLENLSPDPENAFFTDGMHAEIIATLQRTTDLRVIGRDSALAFKRGSTTVAEFAQRVGAGYFLTGSVRRAGTKARILLELRRASDDALLWSSPNAERDLTDIFAVQSEVAEQVARVLQARAATGSFVLARFTTQNPKAYDLFIRAYSLFNSAAVGERNLPAYVATIEHAEQAIVLDPNFAGAASLLALANWWAYRTDQDPLTRLRYAAESKRWAETAARLVPGGAGDYGLASYHGQLERDYARGLTYAQNVVRALPNEAAAYNYVGIFSSALGQDEEALSAWRRAITLDPLRPVYWANYLQHLVALRRVGEFQEERSRYHASTGGKELPEWQYFLAGELPASLDGMSSNVRIGWLWRARRVADVATLAAAALGKAETKDLDRLIYLRHQTDALQKLGRQEDAEKSAVALMVLVQKLAGFAEVGLSQKQFQLAVALARLGRADEAVDAARRHMEAVRMGAPRLLLERELEVAELYAYLNRPRECVELLAKLLRAPTRVAVPMLKVDPTWDNVREDAGFKALLADPKNSAPL